MKTTKSQKKLKNQGTASAIAMGRRQQTLTKDWSGLYETPLEENLKKTPDGVTLGKTKAVWC